MRTFVYDHLREKYGEATHRLMGACLVIKKDNTIGVAESYCSYIYGNVTDADISSEYLFPTRTRGIARNLDTNEEEEVMYFQSNVGVAQFLSGVKDYLKELA